jgi:uncharacterized membrane protein YgdD (TMEM256/DUF423 family)
LTARFRLYAILIGVFGFAGVAIGAFGAHGLDDPDAKRLIDIGAHYQMVHALAALGALVFWRWGAEGAKHAAPFFFGGIWLFSGSLYALALHAPRWVGVLTPIGGVLFMLGWLLLAFGATQLKPTDN